ncbi:hypothetical protein R1flu_005928 [Riccia fluitans]|uniref:Uncharacterized protein n=1 Tax=Riccia fluitans TaxID=41844 RepID=A0ABD1YXC4_9MARC
MKTPKWWMTEHPSVVSFRWNNGVTFGASYSFMISAALGYLVLIFFLHSWMKRRPNPEMDVSRLHHGALRLSSMMHYKT